MECEWNVNKCSAVFVGERLCDWKNKNILICFSGFGLGDLCHVFLYVDVVVMGKSVVLVVSDLDTSSWIHCCCCMISPTISPFFTPDQTNKTTLMLIPNFMFIRSWNSSCCYAACCSCHTGWWEKSSSAPYVYDQPFFHTSWPGLAWVPTQCRADIDLLMLQLLIISWHLGFKCTLVQNPNKSDKLFGFFKNWKFVMA